MVAKKQVAAVLALVGSCVVLAAPQAGEAPANFVSPVQEIRVRCAMCEGRGGYKARPPDLDQHRGTLDSREHWDVKVKRCPFCDGKGRRTVYDLTRPEPKADVIPCKFCGWSGIKLCTYCTATGFEKCRNRECRDGWIIRKPKGRKSFRRAESVDMCPDCSGKGKVICTHCRGLRAEICPRCNGMGRDLAKEAKERERQAREEAKARERQAREDARRAGGSR